MPTYVPVITTILGVILAALIGAWINNVFTWKIKNRIDALDVTYIDVLGYNDAFLSFCKEQRAKYTAPKGAIEAIANNQRNSSVNFDPELLVALDQKLKPLINQAYLNYYIIDEVMAGELYQKMYKLTMFVDNNISKYSSFTVYADRPKSLIVQEYELLLHDLLAAIFDKRKKITSFSYMVNRIFFNIGSLIVLPIIANSALVAYCYHVTNAAV